MSYLTVLAVKSPSAYEELGPEPLGHVYYDDPEHNAHKRYGVEAGKGAVVVLRPDGWLGTMMVLGREIAGELERYFERIFLPRQMLQHL